MSECILRECWNIDEDPRWGSVFATGAVVGQRDSGTAGGVWDSGTAGGVSRLSRLPLPVTARPAESPPPIPPSAVGDWKPSQCSRRKDKWSISMLWHRAKRKKFQCIIWNLNESPDMRRSVCLAAVFCSPAWQSVCIPGLSYSEHAAKALI